MSARSRWLGLGCALVLAAGFTLAACGGGGGGDGDSGSGGGDDPSSESADGGSGDAGGSEGGSDRGSDGNGEACELVTQSEAEALFGEPAVQEEDDAPGDLDVSSCIWSTVEDENNPDDLDAQLLQFRIYGGEQFYSGEIVEDVADLDVGEKGYISVGAGGTDLQFVIDGKVYALSYNDVALGSGTPNNHEAEIRALAEKIANEVG